MDQLNSAFRFIRRREIDNDVSRRFQKHLHVNNSLLNRLGLEAELDGHTGCVNCLEWDGKGRILASGSDDSQVIIWDPFLHKKLETVRTGHHGNIFSVKFMPGSNDSTIVTAAGDYEVRVHNLICKETVRTCMCHGGRVKRLAIAPDSPQLYWSAAEDGIVRQFDLRESHVCQKGERNVLVDLRTYSGEFVEAKCIAVNPLRSEMVAVGANDPYIRIYDRRMIELVKAPTFNASSPTTCEDNVSLGSVQYFIPGHVPCQKKWTERELREFSTTYLTFGPSGNDLLVNLGSEHIYLFDIRDKSRNVLLKKTNDNREISGVLKTYCNASGEKNPPLKFPPSLPQHVINLKTSANDLFAKEEYTPSIRLYNEAITIFPHSSVFYANRAAAYIKRNWRGDIYAALKDCISALHHDSNNVKAFFRIARCLFEMSWYQEAQNCLAAFKERFPEHTTSGACKSLEKEILCKLKAPEEGSEGEDEFPMILQGGGKEAEWREGALDYDQRYCGHCNITTDIKEANFFGSDGQYVVAGSDDGCIFVWETSTTNNVAVLKGDTSIVNCLLPHPTLCFLATSGIEHVVRLWSPLPQDGKENTLSVKDLDKVAVSNQKRMTADPLDVVFMNMDHSNMEYWISANGRMESGDTFPPPDNPRYNCRPS